MQFEFRFKRIHFSLLVSDDVTVSEVFALFLTLTFLKINAWTKVACVLCSEWPQKERILKWLENQSMKHWKSLTKINLTKKLPFSSTFQEVEFHEVDETIETLNRLSLFTEDSSFDPLTSKLTRIISQGRRDKMRQSLINNFFINSNEYKLVMLLKKIF